LILLATLRFCFHERRVEVLEPPAGVEPATY
jgi:hypothetical protein